MEYIITATASFGLEAVVKREIEALGYEICGSSDGSISFKGDEKAIVRANLWLRTADRVFIKVAEFKALEFPELIKHAEAAAWENYIPKDGKFTVIGTSAKSQLHSVPACQATIKKAIVNRLKKAYSVSEIPETGEAFTVRFAFHKDVCSLLLDTSGEGLHKRGYRVRDVSAPIKETLASAMVQLSFFKPGRLLCDPMCGSGTIAIEAAMLGRNIAPGLGRKFAAEGWSLIPKELWQQERKAAFSAIDYGADIKIEASDIDKKAVEAARENALEAGVDDCIAFHIAPVSNLSAKESRGVIVTNPPYGQRIGDQKEMDGIYKNLSFFMKENPDWSLFLITADKTFEKKLGRPADRRRKLFNGGIEACYYQYHGKK